LIFSFSTLLYNPTLKLYKLELLRYIMENINFSKDEEIKDIKDLIKSCDSYS